MSWQKQCACQPDGLPRSSQLKPYFGRRCVALGACVQWNKPQRIGDFKSATFSRVTEGGVQYDSSVVMCAHTFLRSNRSEHSKDAMCCTKTCAYAAVTHNSSLSLCPDILAGALELPQREQCGRRPSRLGAGLEDGLAQVMLQAMQKCSMELRR
eukprot:6423072-Amphidinium_carterae.1